MASDTFPLLGPFLSIVHFPPPLFRQGLQAATSTKG